ncbi:MULTISPECIES: hypothetical protein [unclassified Duganella]|uniref:hypothetical protein n=1 Tax=unclassified Duganella TaxID=2636909 RepID=UPI0006FB1846|nr:MULTISPECIES: hypothetical protein [unclassified Duganella]KQV54954.1 hypothetical protein ASD07_28710 [Duganella sp. Root336D2]KRB93168.1 hypothetical protein ASE26_28270 [Duganella sp. Root198D2]
MSVPQAYEGLWRRKGIWRANGSSDLVTPVWWFQAADFHIDLRIPVDRKAMTGFAGTTVVEGERCEWRPEIAYPFVSPELDAGFMRFDSEDALHEAGADGSYQEDWWREASGPVTASRLLLEDGRIQYEIACGEFLARATGKPLKAAEITIWRQTPGGPWKIIASTTAARENVIVEAP